MLVVALPSPVLTGDSVADLRSIAQRARRWAERYAREQQLPFPPTLAGMCAIASAELFRRLAAAGHVPLLAVSHPGPGDHCFVVLDSYVLDVTATQFGESAVAIEALERAGGVSYWQMHAHFCGVRALREYLCENQWPKRQLPLERSVIR